MEPLFEADSIFEAFNAAVERFGGRPFLRAPDETRRGDSVQWTYFGASREITRLQGLYVARETIPGSRVAVAFDSRLDVYLHLLALNALGASLVPLNTAGSDGELAWLIDHSDCSLVVSAEEHASRLAKLAGLAGRPAVSLSELAAGPESEIRSAPADSAREAALLYTSGTTGRPKGCILSNAYFLALGRWYNGIGGRFSLGPDDRLLTPLPPHHMNALCVSFMAAMLSGGCVVQLDRFHPSSWWDAVREHKATIVHYLGVMPAILLTLPRSERDHVGDQVRFGFGAGCDPSHHHLFEQRFGFPLLEAWSMTETGAGAVTIAASEPRHVGSRCIGRPSRDMEHRLVDERGRDVRSGSPGQLLVRASGPDPQKGFFSGYYKDEQATRDAWAGGWFHTGDVVREGADGSLFFVDRRKNIIRRSGENVAAVEVEAALLAHPDVRNCAVTAVPDELRGEEVFAFVIPRAADAPPQPSDLVTHCLDHLAYYKVPGYLAFVPELPLTASQKINRAEVKDRARRCAAGNACIDVRHTKKRPRAGQADAG